MPTNLPQTTSQRIAGGFIRIRAGLTLLAGLAVQPLAAQPSGGQVVAGSASIADGAGTLTVTQTSARAIINWQDFSLAAGGLARFIQPDATSATLNRVVSGLPSSLQGTLEANGRIYLINPNGILVGAGARIDTAGFLASTLDVTNQDFLAGGDLHFTGGSTAAIRNLGTINALGGDIFLIARQVENAGAITAAQGNAGLAAGSEVLLTTGGNERLFVLAASVPGSVVNSGTITAASAELKAAGGNAFALAINNTGTVRATGSAVRHGQIWLVATGSGTVATSGTLDASGTAGGGSILVLGGMQDGGRVMVGGTLDASSTGGDGGFIETSAARVQVTDDAQVTTLAPAGRNGTWLIDPVDFTIAASGGDMTGAAVGTALAGGNFTIQSTTGGTGTAGDVNVNDTVSWSANKLTLNAQNNINVNAVMTGSGTASLALEFGQGAVAAGNSSLHVVQAAIYLPAGNNFSTKLGSDGAVKNYTVITSLGAQGSTTGTDLQGMSGNLAGLYALGADIDASATSGWNGGAGFAPVGAPGTPFTGILDGLGHVICDFTISRSGSNSVGLFGAIEGATISHLGLDCASITGGLYVGAFAGSGSGTIRHSYSSGDVTGSSFVGGFVGNAGSGFTFIDSYTTGDISGGGFTGGLIGSVVNGTFTRSHATGNVTGAAETGGLAGTMDGGTISESFATGTVSGTSQVGGLVGNADGTLAVSRSYMTGNVSGEQAVGGLLGYANSLVTVVNSHTTGNVTTTSGSGGGLVGHLTGEITSSYATGNVSGGANSGQIGGLVGFNSGYLTTSYATGAVTSSHANVGALVGDNAGAWVSDSYWNTETSGQAQAMGGSAPPSGNGATGLTTAQMQTAASFSAFVFTTTTGATGNNWVIVDSDGSLNNAGAAPGATFPMLASEYSTTIHSSHQLQLMQMAPGGSYTLPANLVATSTGSGGDVWSSAGFVPIQGFTGTFDGQGHYVSSLTINRPTADNVGLFGTVTGSTISNLGLLDPAITGQHQVGALIGLASGGTVNTSYVIGGTVSGNTDVGGMIGQSYFTGFHPPQPATINNSYTSGTTVAGTTNVGGLVGYNQVGSINRAYSAATVTGTTNVGELVGRYDNGSLSNSFWNETLKATGIGSDALPGDTAGATGMTSAELQQQANFTSATGSNGSSNPEWDMAATWVMYEGHTAPLLRVFMKPLTVTANNDAKTYNGLAYTGGNGVSYACCPDHSLLFGTVGYSGSSQGAVNAGSYAITPTGLYSNQHGYILSFVPGTLTVSKANLALTGTRIYDGSTIFAGINLTATGVNGESFTITGAGASGNLSTKNVQTNQALASVGGLAVGTGNSGAALASNYNNLSITGSSVSVTPLALTITGFAADNKIYDGTTSAVIANAGTLAGVVSGDTVGFSQTGATFDTKDVGTGKTVTLNGVTLTGSGDETNYTHTATVTDVSDITAATLTYTATPVSRTYGSSNPTLGGTIDDFVNSETQATATTGTLTFTTTATVSSNVGTFAINGSGLTANNGNYTFAQAAGNATALTINPANLVLTGTRIYDGSTIFAGINLTATGVNGESFTITGAGASGNLSTKNVQTNQALASVGGLAVGTGNSGTALASNYNSLSITGSSVSVTPLALTINGFASDSKVYNGTTNAVIANAGTLSGVVSGDTVGFSQTGATFDTKDVGTGKTVTLNGVTLTGSGDETNYTHTATVTDLADITPATLTYTATPTNRTYGSGNPTLGGTIDNFVNSENQTTVTSGTLTFTTTATVTSNVGTYAVTGSGLTANNGNYIFTQAAGNATALTINPANLVLTGTRVYDGSTVFAGINLTATGVNGETFTVTGGGTTGNLSTRNVQTNQLLASVTGLAVGAGNSGSAVATNYNALATTGSSVSVTPKALTITADNQAKVYGAADPTLTATYQGLVDTDDASVVGGLSLNTATGALATAGTHAITAAGATSANYTITLVDGVLAVTPATLAVTANAQTKLYGNADPTLTYGVGTLQYTDTAAGVLTGALTRTAGETVAGGPYQIGLGTLTTNANYTVAYTGNELTITPATLTYVANAANRIVGESNPAFNGTVTGFVAGDGLTTATTGALAFDTSATVASPVGIYAINGSGLTANHGNYVFVQAPPNATAFTINPVSGGSTPLTITADDKAKLYGAALPAFTESYNGFINGDTSASVTGLQFSTSATVSSNVGTYTITPFGATAPSTYLVGYVSGTLTINPALLNIFADNKSSVYGAALPAFTAHFTGLVNGDTSSVVTGLQFSTTATTGANTGTYAITPSGATAANYSLAYVSGLLTISPATLTLTATDAERDFGAPNPAFTGTFTGFVNGDTAAVVSGSTFSTPATPASATGTYAITPRGATAANYTLAFVDGTLRVIPPSVIVGTTSQPVVTVGQIPALTPEFAVVELGGRLVLVPVGSPDEPVASVDERLSITLGEVTALAAFESAATVPPPGATSTNTANLGRFELAASPGGSGPGPLNEPGLFRESTVNVGGFNIIYHEPLAAAREQSASNTALGSSYREFSDSDNPQTNIVRAKHERKPAEPTSGRNPAGAP